MKESEKTKLASKFEAENKQLKAELGALKVNEAVRNAFSDIDVVDGAMKDILARAQKAWEYGDDGSFVCKEGFHLNIESWAESLKRDAPYFFKSKKSKGFTTGTTHKPGVRVIDKNDKVAFSNNLVDIAKGKVEVH